jgi:1,4-dihydroxy-6-naphthoate synthase
MLTLGFSPCPNDTFIFYGIAKKRIDTKGIDFKILIDDVEILNNLALKGKLDISKISCHAFYYIQKDYQFLRSGGAFGRGCGPLLVKRTEDEEKIKKIAIPGKLTTAFLLLKLYLNSYPSIIDSSSLLFINMPFYEIIGAVKEKKVDAGLIIHESRFTYHGHGLKKIIDLGDWWERETGLPIPLGGIVAKKNIGENTIKIVESLIRASVEYSLSHKEEVMAFIKEHSQEISEDVILRHVGLYVNKYTIDIGREGESALKELMIKAARLESENGGDHDSYN